MVVNPKTKAYLYFNSAIDSEYTMMLRGRYTDEGYIMGEDGSDAGKINAWGTFWYFCKPQKATLLDEKCTSLNKL